MENSREGGFQKDSKIKRGKTSKGVGGKMIQKKNNVEETEEPIGRRGASAVHDGAAEPFGVADLAFGIVLMLMMGFALEILDGVEPKDIKDTFAKLSLGVVQKEAVGCPMPTNEIFQGTGHFGFLGHGVDDCFGTVFANVELCHHGSAMTKDTVIVGRSVAEKGISGHFFIPTINVASREARSKMFAKR